MRAWQANVREDVAGRSVLNNPKNGTAPRGARAAACAEPEWIGITQACGVFASFGAPRPNPVTVLRWCIKGDLAAIKRGKRWFTKPKWCRAKWERDNGLATHQPADVRTAGELARQLMELDLPAEELLRRLEEARREVAPAIVRIRKVRDLSKRLRAEGGGA